MDDLPIEALRLQFNLYKSIKENCGRNFITHRDLMKALKYRLCRIGKMTNYEYLKQIKVLEEMKLIKKIGNTNNIVYELCGKNVNRFIGNFPF